MISLTNHDFQWGRSEVVIIYPDIYHILHSAAADSLLCTFNKEILKKNIGVLIAIMVKYIDIVRLL